MGTRVIIGVLVLICVVITVSVSTMNRQQKSSEELKDLNYSQQARQLANSTVSRGVHQFRSNPEIMDSFGMNQRNFLVDEDGMSLYIELDGVDSAGGSIFKVVSEVTVTDNEATAYTASTEVFIGWGGSVNDDFEVFEKPPLVLDLTGLPSGALWIRIQADGIVMNVANNNSGKNMHQFPSQLDMNPFMKVSREKIEAAGNVVIVPELPYGVVQLSGHNIMMSPSQPLWKIPYPFTLYSKNKELKIDGHILSDHEINVVSTGKITYSAVDKSPDPIQISPSVHFWAGTTITVPSSKPTTKGLLEINKHQNATGLEPGDFSVHHDEDEPEEDDVPVVEEEEVILPPRIHSWVEIPVVTTRN